MKKTNTYRYNDEDDRLLIEDILDFIKTFLICSLIVIFIHTFLFSPKQVSGRSMHPTLQNHQKGVTNVLNANINGIQRYDIVVAKIIENNETSEVIKRVIGMPNDTISCKDEVIYINGEPLDEPYLNTSYKDDWVSKNYYFTKNFSEVKLGEDEYFLMGDNRPLSQDSRDFGPVKKEQILAKDFLVLWPLSEISYLS
ncbi:MAG: signal peptidase I [Faecalitalea cylindroides]